MTITTGSMASALKEVVTNWFGLDYAQLPPQWSQIFDMETSNDAFEEDINFNGFEGAKLKPENSAIQYTSASQAYGKRYQMLTYALGFIMSWEAMQDNKYPKLLRQLIAELSNAMRQSKEIRAANILNRGFNSSYVGADGIELFSSVHLKSKGGTQANELATPADLSELSLEQAYTAIKLFQDDAGKNVMAQPVKLIIPPQLEHEACRITKSELRPNTPNNDINAIKYLGQYQNLAVNNFLTNPKAWFIKTSVPNGLKMYQRYALEVMNDTAEFDTLNMKWRAIERDAFGWTNWLGAFASEGAS